jgi:hypothetical protein
MERVHCCNFLPAPSEAVSVALHQPVALTTSWMALSILFVVAGVVLVPLFLAIALIGLVVRIAQEFFLLPISLPGTLAFLVTAVALILDSRIGLEGAPAMNALNGPVHGCPPMDDNHNAPHSGGKGEAGRKTREEEGSCMRKRKKRQWRASGPIRLADSVAAESSWFSGRS